MATYDRGTAAGITKIAPLQYAVDSWREEGTTYIVRLDTNSCSCPFSARTGAGCKHQQQARAQRFAELTEKARTLPTERLEQLLTKHEGDRAIWTAISGEIHDRQQVSARDAELRSIFA